ncbi:TPA: hypothetical protein KQB99_003938 [Clostridioides difficile]|nr:hypothetical protein [Clostridioides difficile]HBH4130861.1 hypothetical protein [Clostridioides difficile]HBH4195707.1 hypothetical protein [Clostridioides difficile]
MDSFTIKDIEILLNEIEILNSEITKTNDTIDTLNKNIKYLKYLNKKAKNIIKIYREELEEFKTKAFIPKRKKQQITQKDIDKIKKLSQDGLSYSKIQKITKWSKCTISKVINGYYDK